LSFKALAWAFDQELKNPEKTVLIALAYRDNHDDPHGCFPSIPRIAKDCGISERTAQRCLRNLEEAGVIRSQKRHYRSTFYSIPAVWVVSDSHPLVSHSHPLVSHSHHPGVSPSPPLVSHSHPEPKDLTVIEPKTSRKLEIRRKRQELERQDFLRRYARG